MDDSIRDLDGAFSYLVASSEGLGIVRDRFGFKPMMLVETDDFVAAATEEIALRRAFPGDYRVVEPPPASALFFPADIRMRFEVRPTTSGRGRMRITKANRRSPHAAARQSRTRDETSAAGRRPSSRSVMDCGGLPTREINRAVREPPSPPGRPASA